jgi:hypothetical protein
MILAAVVWGGGGRDYGGSGYGGGRDYGSARFEEQPSGPPVTAVVKWFRADRRFGFVELTGGGSGCVSARGRARP